MVDDISYEARCAEVPKSVLIQLIVSNLNRDSNMLVSKLEVGPRIWVKKNPIMEFYSFTFQDRINTKSFGLGLEEKREVAS